jgi:ketosteroid isomerase-like protein
MSNANIELVQRLYAAFGRGETAAITGALTPDAPWELNGRREHHPILGRRVGPAGATEFFRTLADTLEFTTFVPQDFHAADGKVFVLGQYSYVSRQTGRSGESKWMHVFTLRDGKVAGFLGLLDTAQLREVAG